MVNPRRLRLPELHALPHMSMCACGFVAWVKSANAVINKGPECPSWSSHHLSLLIAIVIGVIVMPVSSSCKCLLQASQVYLQLWD